MNRTRCNRLKTRKRVSLTLRQKIDICQLLERGVSRNQIMKEFKVGSSTIYDIRDQKEHILKFLAGSDTLSNLDNRKSLRGPKLEQVDILLYDWYRVMRADGLPMTNKNLLEKAKEFHQHLNPDEPCNFTGSWLARFKVRHGIGLSDILDEVKVREASDVEHEGCHLEQKLSDYEPELILEELSTADDKPNNQPNEISDAVKSALHSVYSHLQPKFSSGVAYDGLVVRMMLAATIREVTLQFLSSNNEEKGEESELHKGTLVKEVSTIRRKGNKPELKAKPDGRKILLRKGSSPRIDVEASPSSSHHSDVERNVGTSGMEHSKAQNILLRSSRARQIRS